MGEITAATRIVNCCTGDSLTIAEAPFYRQEDPDALASLVEELRAELLTAKQTIDQLRARLAEFQATS
jgi:hypothetical protein